MISTTKRAWIKGAALCLGLAGWMNAPAHAQAVAKPFAVKLGLFLPSQTVAREAGGDTMLMIEGEYTLQNLVGENALTKLSIGHTAQDDFRLTPITLSQTFNVPNTEIGNSAYYGLGIGIYVTELTAPNTSGRVKSVFGGYLVGGLEFGADKFVEAKYHLMNRYDGQNLNGLQLMVGTHF